MRCSFIHFVVILYYFQCFAIFFETVKGLKKNKKKIHKKGSELDKIDFLNLRLQKIKQLVLAFFTFY